MQFISREVAPRSVWALEQAGVPPLLARLYAARGIHEPHQLDTSLAQLLLPNGLTVSYTHLTLPTIYSV